VFTSFLQSNLRTINDIWDSNNTNFKSCHDIYNLLIDRRNCISEFSKIKRAIPEKFIKVLKGETTIVPERRVTLNINDKLQLLNESNTTISPDKLKIKVIQGIFKQNIKPKCQIKNSTGVILIGHKFGQNKRKSKLLIRSKNSSGNVSII
jgi:hypothetical protein